MFSLRGHLEAHEVLEDDPDLAVKVGEVVLAEVDAVEQDLALGGIVETGDELDDGGLALAVLADERDAFSRGERVRLKFERTFRLVPA